MLAVPTLAQALVVINGTGFTQPGTVAGNDVVWVGNGLGTTGSIDVNGGSTPILGGLTMAWNRAHASGLITGAGTSLTLDTVGGRLSVGSWGTADLAVENGAKILADGHAATCNGNCGGGIGGFAGTTGVLLIRDAGSQVRLRDNFNLAIGSLDTTNGFGTPGAHSAATLTIADGGQLFTAGGQAGGFSSNPSRAETTTARINIVGAGSLWSLSPGSHANAGSRGPVFALSTTSSNQSFLTIADGGEMRFNSAGTAFAGLNTGTSGGSARITVSGTGSALQFHGESTFLQLANSAGASVAAAVTAGGSVQGLYYLAAGRNGGTGSLLVDGAGSLVSLTGTATAAANGNALVAILDIGRAAGSTGIVTVSNGGRIDLAATANRGNGPTVNLGREGGTGTLSISGAGTLVQLTASSVVPGGGATEAFNPLVHIGRDGNGVLDVNGGGTLRLVGNAVSVADAARDTTLNIGGQSDTATALGRGIATVSGAGSRISVAGGDANIRVGRGPGGVGELVISNSGLVETTVLTVGRAGQGQLLMDRGTVNLSGQFGSNSQVIANLGIGNLNGVGVATLRNQSVVNLNDAHGAGVFLGGTGLSLRGTGILTVGGGSSVNITSDPNLARFVVGHDGTGIASFDNSTLAMAGGRLSVASQPGSSGILQLLNNSVVTTGWAGVGRDKLADGTVVDGGSGQLIINNSTLSTDTLEIGSLGYLGGNGTVVGNIINNGLVNPGNSPGTLVIDGSFINAAGGRIVLEIESDGAQGFNTDHLVFAQGSTVNLGAAAITFRFLGDTDPNAFQASGGFDIDNFLALRTPQGDVALTDAAFAGVQFGAESPSYTFSNFSYDAAAGAAFTAAAVPEPGSTAMLLAGLATLGWLARRRRPA